MCLLCSYLLIFIAFTFTCSCTGGNQSSEMVFSPEKMIKIQDKISKDEIEDLIVLDSYIPLSNDYLLGESQRIVIYKERIYILDDEPKITCFNMQGNAMFKIDSKGPGPTEYQNIKDFAIDSDSERIVLFDNERRQLNFHELKTGKFMSSIPTHYMAPTEIGMVDGKFFFKNMDTRFDVQKEHQFYLLYSTDGRQIDEMFLPHDAVASFNFDMNSFFYNEGKLLFVSPFDNTVYSLTKGHIAPAFEIMLPNPLPMKRIEEKMRHIEIPASGYSYGIDNVYTTKRTLHFTFVKDRFIVSNFIDLPTQNILYSGIRVLGNSRKQLPVYSLIDGTYNGKFFSLVSASSIVERRSTDPDYFPGKLLNINEEDNGVLAFFIVKDL